MTEVTTISERENRFLHIRLVTEGARCEVKGVLRQRTIDGFPGTPNIFLDGSDRPTNVLSNPRAILEVIFDGDDVTISEMGKVLANARVEPKPPWFDKRMRNGARVGDCFSGALPSFSFITVSSRCYNWDQGINCKFCNFYANGPLRDIDGELKAAEPLIEATAIAVQSGWRGIVLFTGGTPLPWRRNQWTTDLFEGIMTRFRELLDDDILSQLDFRPQFYIPNDLGQLYKWKRLGITSVEFDTQIMDPGYFKVICPGRGDQHRWFEAQEAAVEIFGSCSSGVVTGIEPMTGLLEGIEERTSRGVSVFPQIFRSQPASAMAGMQPASPEWYVEMFEKVEEIHSRYGNTRDGNSENALALSQAD